MGAISCLLESLSALFFVSKELSMHAANYHGDVFTGTVTVRIVFSVTPRRMHRVNCRFFIGRLELSWHRRTKLAESIVYDDNLISRAHGSWSADDYAVTLRQKSISQVRSWPAKRNLIVIVMCCRLLTTSRCRSTAIEYIRTFLLNFRPTEGWVY